MANKGDELTERELAKLEKKISKVYSKAQSDLRKDIEAYFKGFKEEDEKKHDALKAGEITKEEYKQWRLRTLTSGYRYGLLRDKIARRYLEANKEADALVNETTPSVYALNHNYEAYYMDCRINGY